MTVKEKAYFVFKHRYLIVKRQEDFTEQEHDDLRRMLEYLPELATLRQFADRMYWLFDTPKDFHQASCRRAAIVRDPAFQAVPELVKAMEQLDEEKFPADGLPEQPNQPASTDQQSCGADQPYVSLLGEGAVQVAASKDAGPVRGPELDDVWSDWEPPMVRGADRSKTVKHRETQPQARQANVKSRDSLVEISEESHKIRETHRGFVEKCHALNDGRQAPLQDEHKALCATLTPEQGEKVQSFFEDRVVVVGGDLSRLDENQIAQLREMIAERLIAVADKLDVSDKSPE